MYTWSENIRCQTPATTRTNICLICCLLVIECCGTEKLEGVLLCSLLFARKKEFWVTSDQNFWNASSTSRMSYTRFKELMKLWTVIFLFLCCLFSSLAFQVVTIWKHNHGTGIIIIVNNKDDNLRPAFNITNKLMLKTYIYLERTFWIVEQKQVFFHIKFCKGLRKRFDCFCTLRYLYGSWGYNINNNNNPIENSIDSFIFEINT